MERPLQVNGEEAEETQRKEEQTVEQDKADCLKKLEDVEVKGASDWLSDQEEEGSDWPRQRVCHTHERAIPIQQTVEALDITEEGKQKRTQGHVHESINQHMNVY